MTTYIAVYRYRSATGNLMDNPVRFEATSKAEARRLARRSEGTSETTKALAFVEEA